MFKTDKDGKIIPLSSCTISPNDKPKPDKKKYSSMEKKAYYTGFGCGVTGENTTSNLKLKTMHKLMTKKEKESFSNGYAKGFDNSAIDVGMRDRKKWF